MAERLEYDLLTRLVGDATLHAVCPTIAWDLRPQGSALPALSLSVVSEPLDYTFGGEVDLRQTRVQCDIWAATKPEALAVEGAFLPVVSGFTGTVGATEFQGIFVVSRFSQIAEAADSTVMQRISRDLMVNHKGA
jgi:hypothetical protein